MAVDIRAKVYCSLGTVISGNFADTYAQGSGLIFTRGQVELKGTVKPDVGTKVWFAYQRNGLLARIPRTLRVLSSFADPFRRTTTVQLGCLLTFLENRRPPIEDPNSKEENDVPCFVYDKATLPISAKYVVEQILSAVGMTSETVPLTNYFSVEEFDLTPGFIQVLGDLLVSEGYLGYLDEEEVLRFRDLAQELGSGPVIANSDIVDIGPIGVGDLPGDAVIVRYSSLRLKPPDELEDEETRARRGWEWEESFGPATDISISYTDEEGEQVVVNGTYNPYTFSATTYDRWDRAVERLSYEQSSVAEVNGRWAADKYVSGDTSTFIQPAGRMQYTKWGYKLRAPSNYSTSFDIRSTFWNSGALGVKGYLGSIGAQNDESASECIDEPPEGYEEVIEELNLSFISEAELAGTLSLETYIFEGQFGPVVPDFSTAYTDLESETKVVYEKDDASGITKTYTTQQLIYGKTTTGQQDLARLVENPPALETANQFNDWVDTLLGRSRRLRFQGVDTRIRTEREYGLQRRPSQKERNETANQKPEVTEQKAEVTWITGSTESTNVIEFSMPYAPDDRIQWSEEDGYTSTPSDAGAKALKFGRIQNRLLLGNRSGVSLQLPIELLPPRPFDPLYLQAEGLVGQYRVNASTFTFDSNGIVASADCLFWGGVGQGS